MNRNKLLIETSLNACRTISKVPGAFYAMPILQAINAKPSPAFVSCILAPRKESTDKRKQEIKTPRH